MTADPYTRASSADSRRTFLRDPMTDPEMVRTFYWSLELGLLLPDPPPTSPLLQMPEGWEVDEPAGVHPLEHPTDIVLYELHIRDFRRVHLGQREFTRTAHRPMLLTNPVQRQRRIGASRAARHLRGLCGGAVTWQQAPEGTGRGGGQPHPPAAVERLCHSAREARGQGHGEPAAARPPHSAVAVPCGASHALDASVRVRLAACPSNAEAPEERATALKEAPLLLGMAQDVTREEVGPVAPDSPLPQQLVLSRADKDSFNWGYGER